MAIVLISEPFRKANSKALFVMAKCQCGIEFEFRWNRRQTRVSCGCQRKMKTHGQSRSSGNYPTYKSWRSMRSRCNNRANHNYPHYGGRGITVCERWESFENFKFDMGERPPGMTLDRIDFNKGYSPENCRWASQIEQARNKSNNRLLTIYQKTMCASEWCAISGAKKETVNGRLKRGWTHKEAVFGKPKD